MTDSSSFAEIELPDDPELRQLIAESTWNTTTTTALDSDNDDDGIHQEKNIKANNHNNNKDSDFSDNMWNVVMKSFDLHEDRQKVKDNNNNINNKSTIHDNNNNFSSLGIRKDETSGKTVMHIDPTGVFFGATGNDDDDDDENTHQSDTSVSSSAKYVIDKRTRQILADEANALTNSEAEAFDYEMSGDDLAFYEELKSLVSVREELLKKMNSNNDVSHHQNSNSVALAKAPETIVSNKSSTQEEDDDDEDDLELQQFLKQTKDRNAELYNRFVVEKQKQKEKEEQQAELLKNKQHSTVIQQPLNSRRVTAAAELRQQLQAKTGKKASSSTTTDKTMPPQVAKLLKEIILDMENEDNEDEILQQKDANETATTIDESILTEEERTHRQKREVEMIELKNKTKELVHNLKKTRKQQKKEEKKQANVSSANVTPLDNDPSVVAQNKIKSLENEIIEIATKAASLTNVEPPKTEKEGEEELSTKEKREEQQSKQLQEELETVKKEIEESVKQSLDVEEGNNPELREDSGDKNDETNEDQTAMRSSLHSHQKSTTPQNHNTNHYNASMERLTSSVLEPLPQSTLLLREVQKQHDDSDLSLHNMITDVRRNIVDQQLKRLMKIDHATSQQRQSQKSTGKTDTLTTASTPVVVNAGEDSKTNSAEILLQENERKINLLLQQQHLHHQQQKENRNLGLERKTTTTLMEKFLNDDGGDTLNTLSSNEEVAGPGPANEEIIIDPSLLPSAPKTSFSSKQEKENTLRDRRKKINDRKLLRERREADERAKMADIDQILHRELWIRERDDKEFKETSEKIFSAEIQARMTIRSEESMRIHDLRTRELRQRTIVSEWQNHQKNQKEEQARKEIVMENEPTIRQKIQDMESVSWVEVFSAFSEQRDLIQKEEDDKKAEKERSEKEQREKDEEALRLAWDKMKSEISVASLNNNNSNKGGTNRDAMTIRQKNFIEALKNSISVGSADHNKKSSDVKTSSCDVLSIPKHPIKPSTIVSLGIDTERFFGRMLKNLAENNSDNNNNNNSRYLPASTTTSLDLLQLLNPKTTAKGMMILNLRMSHHPIDEQSSSSSSTSTTSTVFSGLPSSKVLKQMVDVFNYLRHLEQQKDKNPFMKKDAKEKIEDEIQSLTSLGPSRALLHCAKKLHEQVNVIDASFDKEKKAKDENNFSNNQKFSVAIPPLASLGKRFQSLVLINLSGNHGLRCVEKKDVAKDEMNNLFSFDEDEEENNDNDTTITINANSSIRSFNVRDCKLTSLQSFFSSSSPSSLIHLDASKNLLSTSIFPSPPNSSKNLLPTIFPDLVSLNLSRNKIESLSSSEFCYKNFPSVQILNLSDNLLKSLPSSILQHPKLRTLNVSQNYLKEGLINLVDSSSSSSNAENNASSVQLLLCLPCLEVLDVSDQKVEMKRLLFSKVPILETTTKNNETKLSTDNHLNHHHHQVPLFVPCLRKLDISFNTELEDISCLNTTGVWDEAALTIISDGIKTSKVDELKKQIHQGPSASLFHYFRNCLASNSIPDSKSTTSDQAVHVLNLITMKTAFDHFFSNILIPNLQQHLFSPSSNPTSANNHSSFEISSTLFNSSNSNTNKKIPSSTSSYNNQNNHHHRYRLLRLSSSAITLSTWFRRTTSFSRMADIAQRKIAPIWRGAWVRHRLRKNKNNNLDDLDFEIPDGVNEDDFLNEASSSSKSQQQSIVEVLRKRMQELDAESSEKKATTNSTTTKIPTPPPTSNAAVINKNKKLFAVDNSISDRPFSPYPPSARITTIVSNNNNTSQLARANTPLVTSSAASSALQPSHALIQQQQKERASSATVGGHQKTSQQNNNNNTNSENGGDQPDGWSSQITDLLKYRDRKRKQAQSARARQDWQQQTGGSKKGFGK